MARFIATIKGARGQASRIGHATSGIHSHTTGWELGVKVEGHAAGPGGTDVFAIYATSGSNGGSRPEHIATITRNPDGSLRVTSTRTALTS